MLKGFSVPLTPQGKSALATLPPWHYSSDCIAIRILDGSCSDRRGRALEVLLGCDDFSAELAERYGYINRALPADELTPFVERLAHRIASFPAHTVAHVKAAVDLGTFGSLAEGLLVEARESDLSVASEVTQARVAEALKVGAETYEGELELEFLSRLSPIR